VTAPVPGPELEDGRRPVRRATSAPSRRRDFLELGTMAPTCLGWLNTSWRKRAVSLSFASNCMIKLFSVPKNDLPKRYVEQQFDSHMNTQIDLLALEK
jgi:hypothetical protein